MKIGVLSDTHGLLRPEVSATLSDCEAILHAGDINRQEIIDALAAIAPVHVVRGNNDREWAAHIPPYIDFTLAGLRVYITHKKKDLPNDLAPYDLVVFGHTHRYEESRSGGTLLLNPGSCGPRRFNQDITLAVLTVESEHIHTERVDIAHPGRSVAMPKTSDLKAQIEMVMRETQRGKSPSEIARRHNWSTALVGQIARLYVTHPGVTSDDIMTKMGL